MKRFHLDDQQAFARLSGDHNPLHVDPVAARRLLFGEPVVHGVHLLLWALDQAAALGQSGPLLRVKAQFLKPQGLDRPLSVRWQEGQAVLTCDGQTAARIEAVFAPGAAAAEPAAHGLAFAPEPPRELDWDAMAAASGEVGLAFDPDLAARLFPHLSLLPGGQLAALLAATRIVGMQCPGRHSLFAGLEMAFEPPPPGLPPVMAWRVARADARFKDIRLAVSAPGVTGQLSAHMRPAPAEQPATAALRGRLPAGAFAGASVLVVGGSRGLGEVAAKLVAAAGAEVCLTYASGADDARRVADDIRAAGAVAHCLPFDVLHPQAPAGRPAAMAPFSHVLYFAAPRIRPGAPTQFDPARFDEMAAVFVGGFFATVQAFRPLCAASAVVLYPSTVFLDDGHPKFKEYAAAKAAGEGLAAGLRRAWPGLRIECPRLPRLRTDQTAGIVPETLPEPADVLAHLLSAPSLVGDGRDEVVLASVPGCMDKDQ